MAFNLNALMSHGFFTVQIDNAVQSFFGHVVVIVGGSHLDRYLLECFLIHQESWHVRACKDLGEETSTQLVLGHRQGSLEVLVQTHHSVVKVHTTGFIEILGGDVGGGNHVPCAVPDSTASPAAHEQFALAFNQCLQCIVDFVELHLNSKALVVQLVDIGLHHTRHNRVAHHEQPAVHVVELVLGFTTIGFDLVFTQSSRHHHNFVGECYISELGHDTNVDVTDFAVALFVLDLFPVGDEEVVACLAIDLIRLYEVFDLVVPDSVTFSREDFVVEVFELSEHRVDLWM